MDVTTSRESSALDDPEVVEGKVIRSRRLIVARLAGSFSVWLPVPSPGCCTPGTMRWAGAARSSWESPGSLLGGGIAYLLRLGVSPYEPAGWIFSIVGAVILLAMGFFGTRRRIVP